MAGEGRSRSKALREFPATTVLLLQYGPLVVLPALRFGTPGRPHLLLILTAGVGTAAAVEAAARRLPSRERPAQAQRRVSAYGILGIGLLAQLVAVSLGAATYATQIGSTNRSAFAALATPFSAWALIGCALVIHEMTRGAIAKRRGLAVIGAALCVQLLLGIEIARLAPFMTAGLVAAFLLWMVRLLRLRWVMIGIVAVSITWPALYELRNAQRVSAGGQDVELALHDPRDRLRLDRHFSQVAELDSRLPAPDPLEVMRFGLVPRFIDSGRRELSSGQDLNVALGGPSSSAASLTVFGNVYVYLGIFGVMAYAAVSSILLTVVRRRSGPWWTGATALIVGHLLWIEATFPDSIAALLQGVLALGGAIAASRLLRSVRVALRSLATGRRPQRMPRGVIVGGITAK